MAIAVQVDYHGITLELYDDIVETLGLLPWRARLPECSSAAPRGPRMGFAFLTFGNHGRLFWRSRKRRSPRSGRSG
jgi:hypothetical protein